MPTRLLRDSGPRQTSDVSPEPPEPPPSTKSAKKESLLLPAPPLANSRYNRQILIPQLSLKGQDRLASASVLIIGLGGLGSPASLYLAAAGIGKLGFVDGDVVEESNLHRQIVHVERRIGMSKVRSAIEGCKSINSTIEYEAFEERLESKRVFEIMQGYDVVMDCTDNPATRYLISDACVVLGKTLVSGAAQRVEGQLMTLFYPIPPNDDADVEFNGESEATVTERGPCYRCVFPRPPPPDMVRGCSEIGILGSVVGAIGTLMATEVVKLVVKGEGYGRGRKPSMLLYNAWSEDPRGMFRMVGLRGRRRECVACGNVETLEGKGVEKLSREGIEKGRMDYVAFCGVQEDVKLLGKEQRIGAGEFVSRAEEGCVVVDVREEYEFEIGMKVKGSVNVPISRILRDAKRAYEAEEYFERARRDQPVYFVCQRGNDSQIAAQKLIDMNTVRGARSRWIGDVEGGFVAMEKNL